MIGFISFLFKVYALALYLFIYFLAFEVTGDSGWLKNCMKAKRTSASDYTTGLKRSALFTNLIQGNVVKTNGNTYNNVLSVRPRVLVSPPTGGPTTGPATTKACIVANQTYEVRQDVAAGSILCAATKT